MKWTKAETPEAAAAYVITIAMILYATGRFTGAAISKVIKPNLLLALYGIANCIITLVVMADIKHFSWTVLPFCWLFMSIMFPFIFAMSLRNLGEKTKLAASAQIMSIVGGAVAPPLMWLLAARYHSMAICFILPLIGFIAPTIYGFAYPRLLEKSRLTAPPMSPELYLAIFGVLQIGATAWYFWIPGPGKTSSVSARRLPGQWQ